jgi:HlyD family secretion protein
LAQCGISGYNLRWGIDVKKVLLVIGISILVLTAALFLSKRGEKAEGISATGIVEGREVNLSSKVPGRISGFCCKEGDRVSAGDVVLRLESEDIKASVEQARAGVLRADADVDTSEAAVKSAVANTKKAEADVRSAEADMERARVRMEEAQREMERAERLYSDGLISRAERDLAETSYEESRASYSASEARLGAALSNREAASSQLNSARGLLASSRARVKEAEASLLFQEARLRDMEITTPISGTVVFKGMEEGEVVNPGVTILSIVDLEDLWVRIDLEETLIAGVRIGDEAVVGVEGMPGVSFKGRVAEIGREAEFATQKDVTRGRQDIKTFRVKIKVTDRTGTLKPGMTVKVEIQKKIQNAKFKEKP